jgi:SAM-dependent methyltransferase
MMTFPDLARGLRLGTDGIYRSPEVAAVSYSDEDHDACFAVEDSSFWFQHRNACIAALVARYQTDGLFLDIGGGNGFVTRRLIDDGIDAALIEPGPHGADNARFRRSIPHVICSTLEQASIPSASVSAAGMFDVLEHIEADSDFVADVARILEPGGMFFATVPAHAYLWSTADDKAGHFRRYNEASLRSVLAPHFDVAFASYFFAPLIAPIYVLRALPYRLGIRQRAAAASEHGTSGGATVSVMAALLAREARLIAKGHHSHIGASLIVAARKRASGNEQKARYAF